jgi:predicted 3-demethylubiquinone-9 3-methyltransferase (glyoxalase superfamily)
MKLQKITPFLWFESGAADAAAFYTRIFKNSAIINSNAMVTHLQLEGTQLMILNGGPVFKLNEAFSLVISCDTQEEIDYYWDKLTEGGFEGQCGWLKDKFGVSWQVVPVILYELLADPVKAGPVTAAFMKMKKFDIDALKAA